MKPFHEYGSILSYCLESKNRAMEKFQNRFVSIAPILSTSWIKKGNFCLYIC